MKRQLLNKDLPITWGELVKHIKGFDIADEYVEIKLMSGSNAVNLYYELGEDGKGKVYLIPYMYSVL